MTVGRFLKRRRGRCRSPQCGSADCDTPPMDASARKTLIEKACGHVRSGRAGRACDPVRFLRGWRASCGQRRRRARSDANAAHSESSVGDGSGDPRSRAAPWISWTCAAPASWSERFFAATYVYWNAGHQRGRRREARIAAPLGATSRAWESWSRARGGLASIEHIVRRDIDEGNVQGFRSPGCGGRRVRVDPPREVRLGFPRIDRRVRRCVDGHERLNDPRGSRGSRASRGRLCPPHRHPGSLSSLGDGID